MIKFWVIFALIVFPSVSSDSESSEYEDDLLLISDDLKASPPRGHCTAKCSVFEPFKLVPHDNCRKYCVCVFGFTKVKSCKNFNFFSPLENACVPPSMSDCVIKYPDCIGKCPKRLPSNVAVILMHDDCKKFCRCRDEIAEVIDCPDNQLFDDDSAMCQPEEEAKCDRMNSYVPPSSEASTPPAPTDAPTPPALTDAPATTKKPRPPGPILYLTR